MSLQDLDSVPRMKDTLTGDDLNTDGVIRLVAEVLNSEGKTYFRYTEDAFQL